MLHWKTILDGAGDFLFYWWWESPRAFKKLFTILCMCSCCTQTVHWCICVCKCESFACLQSSISFQPLHLVGRAFPVCCVSPTCQIEQGGTHSSLIMTWHVRRVGWLWQWEGERGGEKAAWGKGSLHAAAGFILTSFPRAPHTSWNSLNYTPSMAPRSKWHSKKVLCDRLWSLERLLHDTPKELSARTKCVQLTQKLFCVLQFKKINCVHCEPYYTSLVILVLGQIKYAWKQHYISITEKNLAFVLL